MLEENKNEMYNELVKSVLRANRKTVEQMKIICLGVLVSSCLIVGSVVGGALYFFSAYSVEVEDAIEYDQSADGNSSIVNGNQYKDNALHQEQKSDK